MIELVEEPRNCGSRHACHLWRAGDEVDEIRVKIASADDHRSAAPGAAATDLPVAELPEIAQRRRWKIAGGAAGRSLFAADGMVLPIIAEPNGSTWWSSSTRLKHRLPPHGGRGSLVRLAGFATTGLPVRNLFRCADQYPLVMIRRPRLRISCRGRCEIVGLEPGAASCRRISPICPRLCLRDHGRVFGASFICADGRLPTCRRLPLGDRPRRSRSLFASPVRERRSDHRRLPANTTPMSASGHLGTFVKLHDVDQVSTAVSISDPQQENSDDASSAGVAGDHLPSARRQTLPSVTPTFGSGTEDIQRRASPTS